MHCGYIVRVDKLEKSPKADKLLLATFFGETTWVNIETKEGDLGVYFPDDLELSLEFCLENNLLRELPDGTKSTGYLDKNRHIKAINLRGTRSSGIYLPISCLDPFIKDSGITFEEGETITIVNGHEICKKFIPKPKERNRGEGTSLTANKKRHIKEMYPHFLEHVDTPQLRFSENLFSEGNIICLTEKLHGTSSRNAYTKKVEIKRSFLDKIFKRKGKVKESYEYIFGTRRTIKTKKDSTDGFYESIDFRKKWQAQFEGKLRKGETVYGEIVGYTDTDKLIMPTCKNSLTNDKNFIKKYGEITSFTYGCGKGECEYYIYRMTYTTPEGEVIEYPWSLVKQRAEEIGVKTVPELETFIYTTKEDLTARISKYLDVPSTLDHSHVSEGVVVRDIGASGLKIAKEKSYTFKVLEGIIKDVSLTPDIEEAEGLE